MHVKTKCYMHRSNLACTGAAPQGAGGDCPPNGFKKGKKIKIWGIFMH